MNDLLIEIGAEEIPAGYIIPALKAFEEKLLNFLDKARVGHGNASYFGTPRRLALIVRDVATVQRSEKSTITGPPERIGFDDNGKPTIAAEKFAKKAGVSLNEISVEATEKGRYLCAVREEKCESAALILKKALPRLILAIPFPKSMRWGDLSISFARPIISVTAILGDDPIEFQIGNVKASPYVFGHEFMSFEKYKVNNASEYLSVLRSAGVIADINERKNLLLSKIEEAASSVNSIILKDDELVDIVTNLVEYPYPVVGKFDDEFLELPDEVLITAMREHQKYFALTDKNGKLKSYFIAVNNTKAKDMNLVAKGHGKVIRARLSDSRFFYKVDNESTLDDFSLKLKSVTFQAELGSMFQKRQRLISLCQYLADIAASSETSDSSNLATSPNETNDSVDKKEYKALNGDLKKNLVRAAEICKSDLVSQMVIEFTKLQGVIGRTYALNQGENKEVARAIEEHYMPVYSGGPLPETQTGKLLAIADKTDTICGCFFADLIPTGASDPYALRRQALGIIQIILNGNFKFSIKEIVEKGLFSYEPDPGRRSVLSAKIMEFLKRRMVNMLVVDHGFSREAVNSAVSVSFNDVPDALLRVRALDALRQAPDFEPLSIAFKRVVNILKKAGALEDREEPDTQAGQKTDQKVNKETDIVCKREINETLFESDAERNLFEQCQNVSTIVSDYTRKGDYDGALSEIAGLRPGIDKFFDDVMVMTDDTALRNNRIALLSFIADLFRNIADFSMI